MRYADTERREAAGPGRLVMDVVADQLVERVPAFPVLRVAEDVERIRSLERCRAVPVGKARLAIEDLVPCVAEPAPESHRSPVPRKHEVRFELGVAAGVVEVDGIRCD